MYEVFSMDNLFQGRYCRVNSYLAGVQQDLNSQFAQLTTQFTQHGNQLAQLTTQVTQYGNQLAQLTTQVTQHGNQLADMSANINAIVIHLGIRPAH